MTRELLPAGRRELSRAHITFYRAVMEGVDLHKAWDVYMQLEGDFTETLAKATMGWVRQALIQEALATGQAPLIGLFRREPWRVKSAAKPTLTEFASRFEGAGDFSERELTEMWKEEYGGPDRAEARRERLSQRLRQALQLLERTTRRQPKREDLVATWLAPNLAAKLAEAKLDTLGAVRDALAVRKTPRWEEVPGVGEVWADRLERWMDEHAISAQAPALPATLPAASQLVPLERFTPPRRPALRLAVAQGQTLVARAPSPYVPGGNAIGALDDKHAIELWLAAKAKNPNTLRSYRKNAERLLLWCVFERQTTFPEMTAADAIHYRAWLESLGRKTPEEWAGAGWRMPAEAWFGPRGAKRHSPEWRPFDGKLSEGSVAQDLLTVRSLFEFLLDGLVVQVNPFKLLGKRAAVRPNVSELTEQFTGRSFTLAEWHLVVDGLGAEGCSDMERRLLLVLWLGFACGLRASEMLSLTLGSIVPGEVWRLKVTGKGNKTRNVPLPSPVRDLLLSYLESVDVRPEEVLRIARLPKEDTERQAPLLRSRRGRRRQGGPAPSEPLRYTVLYESLKKHLALRGKEIGRRDPAAAAKFKEASTHWLRHTCATLALKDGVPLNAVQRLLGHASLTTTSVYVTEHEEALMNAMEKFIVGASRQ